MTTWRDPKSTVVSLEPKASTSLGNAVRRGQRRNSLAEGTHHLILFLSTGISLRHSLSRGCGIVREQKHYVEGYVYRPADQYLPSRQV